MGAFDPVTTLAGYQLRVDGAIDDPIAVVAYRARESLSELSRFDVDVAVGDVDALLALAGSGATFTIEGAHPRSVAGVLARVTASAQRTRDGRSVARARLVPRLWLLSRGRDSRVFQDRTVPQIIERVLAARRVAVRFELGRRHAVRTYAVQYDESDFDFVARLAAEEGFFFYFEDAIAGESCAVFADGASFYPPIAHDPRLRFHEAGGLQHGVETVRAFSSARSLRPGRVVRSDYDPERPAFAVTARADASDANDVEAGLEVYDPRTEYDAPSVDRQNAESRVAAERSRAVLARGRSSCRRLAPGRRFVLEGHAEARENGEHVVVTARHEGFVPALAERARPTADAETHETFSCSFEAVPAGVLYRPPIPRRAPSQVLESAVVVGPEGEEIHTDALGRVKVQFHWDRAGKRDGESACWLRVLTPWAGTGWGVQCIPRVGMEVAVSFLGGDPDRPVVMGALVNETHPPPFVLPQERTRTGIRTRSSPRGSGFNELSFDDAIGREQLVVRAERDLVESAENDHLARVARDRRISVRRDHTLEIGGVRATNVTGSSSERVVGDRSVTVGGHASSTVAGDAATTVAGTLEDRVGGGVDREIGGGLVESIGGDADRAIEGSASTRVGLDAGLRVGGHLAVTVGTEGSTPEALDSGDTSLRTTRDVAVTSGGHVSVTADTALSLTVGGASITLDADTVRVAIGDSSITLTRDTLALVARTVRASATDQLSLKRGETVVVLDDAVEIASDDVRLHALGASLELGTEAVLEGNQVRLRSAHGAGKSLDDGEPPATESTETQLRLVLKDPSGKPYAGKKYVLTLDGKEFPAGKTGGDGTVQETIPPGAVAGELVLTIDDAHTMRVPLLLRRLPPIDTTAGVKVRLTNLGYYHGPIDGSLDRATWSAVRRFQSTQGLEVTGAIDAATRAKIGELAGG